MVTGGSYSWGHSTLIAQALCIVVLLYEDPSVPVATPVGLTASAGWCKVLGA